MKVDGWGEGTKGKRTKKTGGGSVYEEHKGEGENWGNSQLGDEQRRIKGKEGQSVDVGSPGRGGGQRVKVGRNGEQ